MTGRPLLALLTAEGVSLVGTRLSMVALPWLVLVTTGSATLTGVIAFAEAAPYAAAQGLGGPLVDRIGARRVSVAADAASALLVGAVPLLQAAGRLSFPALAALVALTGAVRGPGDGAKVVLVPDVAAAAGAALTRVTGLSDSLNRFAGIVGPLLAAGLIAVIGPAQALAVDAATFVLAAIVVWLGVPPVRHAHPLQPSDDLTYLARLRAGASFLRQDRLLLAIVAMVSATNLVDAAYASVLVPVWAQGQPLGATAMGVVAAGFGLGAVGGSLAAAAHGDRLPRRRAYAIGFLLAGAPRFAVLALDAPLWAVAAVCLAAGLGAGVINPILTAVELERIPAHLRGRVMALASAACWGLIPLGGLLGGLLTEAVGLSWALGGFGVLYLVLTLLPLARPEWRDLDASREVTAGRG